MGKQTDHPEECVCNNRTNKWKGQCANRERGQRGEKDRVLRAFRKWDLATRHSTFLTGDQAVTYEVLLPKNATGSRWISIVSHSFTRQRNMLNNTIEITPSQKRIQEPLEDYPVPWITGIWKNFREKKKKTSSQNKRHWPYLNSSAGERRREKRGSREKNLGERRDRQYKFLLFQIALSHQILGWSVTTL